MRGVGAELEGGLIGGRAEVRQEVTDFFLAGIDDLTGWCLVDGVGDIPTQFLEAVTELLQKSVGGHGRFSRHGRLRQRRETKARYRRYD